MEEGGGGGGARRGSGAGAGGVDLALEGLPLGEAADVVWARLRAWATCDLRGDADAAGRAFRRLDV